MGKPSGPALYKEAKWFVKALLGLIALLTAVCRTFGTPTTLKQIIGQLGTSIHLLNAFAILIFLAFNIALIQVLIDENKGAYKDRLGFYARLLVIFVAYVLFFHFIATPNWPPIH